MLYPFNGLNKFYLWRHGVHLLGKNITEQALIFNWQG